MENLIRELKQAIENFNLYLKNEYTTINNKIQGVSNDISDYSVFTLTQVSAKNLKINLTFPRATYVMVSIKGATSSTFVELAINQPTKERLKFYDGSFHKGIIRDIYLTYDFSDLQTMPEVKVYVGYNSTFNPITSVRLADVTSENPLPVILAGGSAGSGDNTNKYLEMLTKQMTLLLEEKADQNNQKLLQINSNPSNAMIYVTYDGNTYTAQGYFTAYVDDNTEVEYTVSLEGYTSQSGTITMDKHQDVTVNIYQPRTLRITVDEPYGNVDIDITTSEGTTTYSQDTGVLTFNQGEFIHYKIYDTDTYDNSVIGADGYATIENNIILNENTIIETNLVPSYTIGINVDGDNLPYGSDTVTVINNSNSVISNATITIIDDDNSIVNTYTTDNKGQAVISELAKTYKVEISASGYTTYTTTITIELNSDKSETITIG